MNGKNKKYIYQKDVSLTMTGITQKEKKNDGEVQIKMEENSITGNRVKEIKKKITKYIVWIKKYPKIKCNGFYLKMEEDFFSFFFF